MTLGCSAHTDPIPTPNPSLSTSSCLPGACVFLGLPHAIIGEVQALEDNLKIVPQVGLQDSTPPQPTSLDASFLSPNTCKSVDHCISSSDKGSPPYFLPVSLSRCLLPSVLGICLEWVVVLVFVGNVVVHLELYLLWPERYTTAHSQRRTSLGLPTPSRNLEPTLTNI